MDVISKPPAPIRWPHDAKAAVSITVAFESYEKVGHYHQGVRVPGKTHHLSLSFSEYGPKVGVWRLFDILERYDVRATFDINGKAAREQPIIVREMAERGHETAGHGWANDLSPDDDDPEGEQHDIRATIEAIEAATGEPPVGWVSPGSRGTQRTLEFLVAEGMRWSGDDASADVPFVKTVAGKRIAIVPRINFASNDLVVWLRPSHAPSTYFEGFKEAFDWVYREGERGNPLWAELLLHSDMGTRPPLINAFERALTYAKGHSDIWFARRGDLADWALSQSAEER